VALLAGCGSSDDTKPAAKVPGVRVAVVVFENNHVDEQGWLAAAAKQGGQATNAHGETNPSFGNYLAILSGSNQGVSDDDISHGPYRVPTLVGQLDAKDIGWRAYFNAMPGPCWDAAGNHDEYNLYAKRHNPFLFFNDVLNDPTSCAKHVVPGKELPKDIAAGKLPQFVWLAPDLCQAAHNCGVDAAEKWMAQALPPLIKALGPKGVLFVTADEDNRYKSTIPLITLGPLAKRGATTDAKVDHRVLLATIEDLLGVPRLATTKDAPSLASLLRQ